MAMWKVLALSATLLVGGVGLLVLTNPPPAVPALADSDPATETPYVVKLHAQWCPLCMMTRGVWRQIESAYGDRVRLVVFDFTTDETTRRTEIEARRLGLGDVFDEYVGETGTILVLSGQSKQVVGDLHGERNFEAYRAAIDAALAVAAGRRPSAPDDVR
jgi:hypothetical protein